MKMSTENNKPVIITFIEETSSREAELNPQERANRKEARRIVDEIVQMGRMSAVSDVVGRSH